MQTLPSNILEKCRLCLAKSWRHSFRDQNKTKIYKKFDSVYYIFFIFLIHVTHQYDSACCDSLEWMSESYGSKLTPIGLMGAEKLADAVFLHGFKIALTASLLN